MNLETMTTEQLIKLELDCFEEREIISQRIPQLNNTILAIKAERDKREQAERDAPVERNDEPTMDLQARVEEEVK